jgi:ribosomal protein S18 acetylase RimI-like enzyme
MPLNTAMLARAAANCAGAYRTWAKRMGKPARLWDDLSCGDLGLGASLPPNNATLLRPATPASLGNVLERVKGFFADGPGGGYEIWSLWPLPGGLPAGFEAWPCPCMVRDRGGERPAPPPELEIVEADDEETVVEAAALIAEVFEVEATPDTTLRRECLGDDFRVWVGRVDGRPVTTATAYIDDGFVGIYAVATARDARRRGYAEAVTWEATLCRPDLPATLQASEMGQPVYERMGYRTVAEFTVWERDRR